MATIKLGGSVKIRAAHPVYPYMGVPPSPPEKGTDMNVSGMRYKKKGNNTQIILKFNEKFSHFLPTIF